MNILFLIAARGGSKGVPNKNICEVGGLPLLAYKAIAAKKSKYCTRLIISTDSEGIAKVASKYEVEVPFLRPLYLATDTSSSMEVVCHAMDWIEQNDSVRYDALCLLEPSSPFLTYEDINKAVELFENKNAFVVLGVKEMEVNSVFIAEIEDDLSMKNHYNNMKSLTKLNRQDMKKEYTMNGAIYLAEWNYLRKNRNFHSNRTYAYIMPGERSIEIDEMRDLYYARFLVEKNIVDLSLWIKETR